MNKYYCITGNLFSANEIWDVLSRRKNAIQEILEIYNIILLKMYPLFLVTVDSQYYWVEFRHSDCYEYFKYSSN